MSENKTKKTSIGGQALIEGIMMRGPEKTAMAVRNTKGEIVLKKWDNKKNTPKIAKMPLLRGIYNMATSLITGYKCLSESAEIAMDLEELERQEAEEKALKELKKRAKKEGRPFEELLTEEEAKKAEAEAAAKAAEEAEEACEVDLTSAEEITETTEAPETTEAAEMTDISEEAVPEASADNQTLTENESDAVDEVTKVDQADTSSASNAKSSGKKSSSSEMGIIMVISVALALVLVVGLFVFLPEFIYNMIFGELSIRATYLDYLGRSAFTGVIKLAILVLYMWGVSFMKDIRRTFMYHGAEHKSIFCHEKYEELTVENVRRQSRFHPRCGTSFLVVMMVLGILISIPFANLKDGIYMVLKLLTLPLVVGLGYEFIRYAGRHDNLFVRIISAPGLWVQRITTLEPTDDMIEVAIRSLKAWLPDIYPEAVTEEIPEEIVGDGENNENGAGA